ncbi:MAG: Asp-tRNA(Asn)/Glu-tRNA(Gln) amidotransferase subunit GatB [Trueperaceae bacterium]
MLEPVIGLEVHLALRTRTKLFCGCPTSFGGEPNVNTCPICLGLPGTLPLLNEQALELALAFAAALGCEIPPVTHWHRKHYFYPDAPKNYQLSQDDVPVGLGGHIDVPGGRRIRITRCHLEEDAGRLVHPAYADHSLVDLNRAGSPLIEMVTEPDIRSAEEARDFLAEVRGIAQALGVSDAAPEEGKMRADVNISLHVPGQPYGTKVEVKNLNSFRSVAAAIEFETKRQTQLLEAGKVVNQETRGWNEGGQKTYLMRTKEAAADYRYLRDPDIPAVVISDERRAAVLASLAEKPAAKAARYVAAGVRPADARSIAYDVDAAAFFDAVTPSYQGDAQAVANWMSEVAGRLHAVELSLPQSALTPSNLVRLMTLVDDGTVSATAAKELLADVVNGEDPGALVASRGLAQVSDEGELGSLVDGVLTANPDLVERVRANPNAINALLGKVMQATKGAAKPDLARRLLEERLK